MNVLVTGGTGVIGAGLIPTLLIEGHTVRLLSRGANEDVARFGSGASAFAADVTDAASLRGAADGCDAVVHVTGIVAEAPPEVTFDGVNVQGTRNVLAEAERAGVKRFVFISSLGADRGSSEYHRSKLAAERAVQESAIDWVILRPGNVYGPEDEVITLLLTMVRTLPAVPVVELGEHRFQPLWYEDLGMAIARALSMPELRGQVLEIAGHEVTTPAEIIDRLATITGRSVARVPIPSPVASLATQLFNGIGVQLPIAPATLTMLLEENVIQEPERNALTRVFGIMPTDLDTGLRALADGMPEQMLTDGVGDLQRKRFWADIEGATVTPEQVMEVFRRDLLSIMPIDFAPEPGVNTTVEAGRTLTAAVPGRGNVQVRVEEVAPTHVTLATLKGHPLSGVIRFSAEGSERSDRIRFQVLVYARASNPTDWALMVGLGSTMQDNVWRTVVERIVARSGGRAPEGVQDSTEVMDGSRAEEVEEWARGLVVSG